MHMKFREGVLDQIVTYAFQHPELQKDAEALAQWARDTYGVPIEGHDPMMAIAHRAVRLIAEYQALRDERTNSRQRKSAPSMELPILPAWMIVSAQTTPASTRVESDEQEVKGVHATALLGTYAKSAYPFLCHRDCLSLLEAAHHHEIKLIDREGYAPCDGCGFPLAGPSLREWGFYPPLQVPVDFVGVIYRVQRSGRAGEETASRPVKKTKGSVRQLSLFHDE